MTDDMPQDPHEQRVGLLSEPLQRGKLLLQALEDQPHYTDAVRVIETLEHAQLAHLAIAVAAEAVATKSEHSGSGDTWSQWWRGVDSPAQRRLLALTFPTLPCWRVNV